MTCKQCGARKRFEERVVWLHTEGGMYMYPPVTRRIECPCGHIYKVEIPRPGSVP